MSYDWEAAEFFAPRAGSIDAGIASAPAPASSGSGWGGGGGNDIDDFSVPSQSARSGSSSSRARGKSRGRGRGTGSRGAAAGGGRGRLPRAAPAAGSAAGRNDFHLPQAHKKKKKEQATTRKSKFKHRGGSFALLGQLWLFEQEGRMRPDIKTLKSAAQRFCDESMEPPAGPLTLKNGYYCGWSSMSSTLEKNGLVDRHKGRPCTFGLTSKGREVAFKVVQEHPDDFGVSNASNNTAHSDADSGGGAGSSSPNAFSPPKRTGAAAPAAPGTRGVSSSVRNPYSPSGGIAEAFTRSSSGGGSGGGSGCGGRGGVSTASALAANAAEARRSVQVASKAKVKAPAAATASVGTARGRTLQGRGQEKHAKRAKLYEMSSPGSPRHGDRGGTSGMLLAALQECGQQGDGKSAASRGKSEPPPPASTAAARGDDELGSIDDDWMSLTSRPVSSPPALEVSSPPPAWNRRSSGGRPKTTSPEPSSVGAVSRRAPPPPPPPPPPPSRSAVPSAGGNKRKTAISSGTGVRGGGVTVVEDVVDISLSDDEDEGDGSDGAEAVAVSSPDRAQAPTELRRSSSSSAGGSVVSPSVTQPRAGGGGGSAIRVGQAHHAAAAFAAGFGATGPGGGGVVPLVPPTLYRSMARGAAAGPSENGALSWRGRACPAWLQRELDAGALSGMDRMVDAFDLVLIVDPGEQRDKVRAPIRDKLERFLSQLSPRRAGLAAASPTGVVGLEMQVARLQTGDFAWAWRRRRSGARGTDLLTGSPEEVLLLDCLVERKKEDDVINSVEGLAGRYRAQKRRMSLCGLTRLIYLLEGKLEGHVAYKSSVDKTKTMRTMETDTLAEGFAIKRVDNVEETTAFLLSLSLQLMASQGAETIQEYCSNPSRPKVSFGEWSTAMKPKRLEPRTVMMEFARCLLMVNGVSAEGARVIAREFPTPMRFIEALRQCSSPEEQKSLVQKLKLADGGKKGSGRTVNEPTARKLVALFADKPLA